MSRGRRTIGAAWRAGVALSLIPGVVLAAPSAGGLAFFVPYGVVGVVLVARRSRNPVGWLLVAAGWVYVLADHMIPSAAPLIAGTAGWSDELLAWLGGWAGQALFAILFAMTILFPEGKLPVGRGGIAARIALIGSAAMVALVAILPRISVTAADAPNGASAPNPYALVHGAFWDQISPEILLIVSLAVLAAGVVAMAIRFVRSRGLERQQLSWLMTSLALITLTIAAAFAFTILTPGMANWIWFVVAFALPTLPLAVGVAVMRYRLYELDTVISRSITYLLLTALLAGTYAATVSLMQKIFIGITGDPSDGAIVFSTLLLASVFTPVRKWLEAAVDRRFKPVHHVPLAPMAGAADGSSSLAFPEMAAWDARMELIARRVLDEGRIGSGGTDPELV